MRCCKTRVEVILVGGTTCGKPYGMMQKNNCSQAYFAIEFDGINSAGQGGYTAGFAPKCAAADDLEHQLGDVNERLLSSAISYSKTGSCPAADSLFHAPAVPQRGQIAHMCKMVGLTVLSLKRIRVGRVPMAGLPVGQWRYLLGYERFSSAGLRACIGRRHGGLHYCLQLCMCSKDFKKK